MEKYGTIPPRFTREWWEHYWHYYKFHIIFGLILLIGAVYLVISVVTKKDYDLNVEIVTHEYYLSPDTTEAVKKRINYLAENATGNDKAEVEYKNEIFSEESDINKIQQNNAVITRIMAEVEVGAKQLYIVDKEIADYLLDFECLLPVSEWTEAEDEDIYEDKLLSLCGNSEFEKMGFDTSELYIGVLELRDSKKDDEALKKKVEIAKSVACEIIKE